ncbi:MAG: ferric iron uptake transcriptional regulator [Comamonadaceae bacterium]|nr:ferric iron uptake transcriptional regulator [Comamonadaceae bacterium]
MTSNIEELKSTGLKATLPRLKILEIFQKAEQRHMTAEDVYRILLDERSDIGLATVYRVLTQFEQAGILDRRNFESGKAIYELNEGQPHDHMVCTVTGKVEEFYDAEIDRRLKEIAEERGWVVHGHAITIYGVSPGVGNNKSGATKPAGKSKKAGA